MNINNQKTWGDVRIYFLNYNDTYYNILKTEHGAKDIVLKLVY